MTSRDRYGRNRSCWSSWSTTSPWTPGSSRRARAAGVTPHGARYVCVAVDPRRVPSAAQVVDGLVRHVGHGIFGIVDGTLFGLLAGSADGATDLADSVRVAAAEALGSHSRLCATVSRAVSDVGQLPRAMADTRTTLALGQDLHLKEPVTGVHTLALERLLATHGDTDAVRQFVDDQIGILLSADEARSSQLLVTLETFDRLRGQQGRGSQAPSHPAPVAVLPTRSDLHDDYVRPGGSPPVDDGGGRDGR